MTRMISKTNIININPWISESSQKHDRVADALFLHPLDKLLEDGASAQKEKSRFGILVTLVTSFTRYTSAHGFAHSSRVWNFNKKMAFFLAIIAITCSVTGIVVGFIMIKEMMHPGYYESKVKAIQGTRNGLPFPRITISNAGFFNYSALEELNVSRYEASLVSGVMVGKLAFTPALLANAKAANRDYHNLLKRLNTTEKDIWMKLSYHCEDIVIDCVFRHIYTSGAECCAKHFTTVLGNLGLSFLTSSDVVQDKETVSAGMSLGVRVPVQQLSLDWEYMNPRATVLQSGLRFNILGDNKGFDSEVSSLVPVTGKERTMVTLTYTKHDNTGLHTSITPWLDHGLTCTVSDAPFEQRAMVGENCHSASVHKCAMMLRHCVLVIYPFWNGRDRICDIEDMVYLMATEVNATLNCQKKYFNDCGSACEDSVYQYATQNTPLQSVRDDVRNSSWYVEGAFTMFYSKLTYTLFTQTRPDFMIMLSSLGGQVGLFMGASLITLAEFTTVTLAMIVWGLTRFYRSLAQ